MEAIGDIIDLERYPLHANGSQAYTDLVARSRRELKQNGMFNLEGFLKSGVAERIVADLSPEMATSSFEHRRLHNIYFKPEIAGLDPDHPALALCETVNHTLCADQIAGSVIIAIYEYRPLAGFLAEVMDKPALHTMDDPLARVNVMAYHDGEALNWHFDRSEFTTTLLLQAPVSGGEFEYRSDLRSDNKPNYDGVARLLRGEDPQVRTLRLSAGTLNVFKGRNTAHRVTPVRNGRERVIAVFSYFERPGVRFSREEQVGFYGRAA